MRSPAALRAAQLRSALALSLRLGRHGKRLWILALVAFLPACVPLSYIVVHYFLPRLPPFPPAMDVFRTLIGTVYLHFILYVLAMVYGLAVISDEVEGKTLIHLLLRPTPRWVIVTGKYVGAWLVTALLLVGSLVATYALVWAAQNEAGEWRGALDWTNARILLLDAIIFLLALAAYVALFSCAGAFFRHGERWGIVFCFGWESLITYLPAKLKWLTLKYHVQTLFPHSVETTRLFSLKGEPLSRPACVIVLLGVIFVFLALTVWNLRRREIR